jgi:hypothetical protein
MMTRRGHNGRRPARARRVAIAAGIAALACAPLALAALPAGVVMLKGATSQDLQALFTYRASAHTLNGYSVSYTCNGRKPVNDSDVYTITDGGNDSRRLATVKSNGSVSLNLRGDISRFTEDGQRPRGIGRLILKAKLTTKGNLRILKGTARVTNAKCPSKALTFRSTVKR